MYSYTAPVHDTNHQSSLHDFLHQSNDSLHLDHPLRAVFSELDVMHASRSKLVDSTVGCRQRCSKYGGVSHFVASLVPWNHFLNGTLIRGFHDLLLHIQNPRDDI